MFAVDAQRAIADLKTLAGFGRCGTGVHRRALTPEDVAARGWLEERMHAAGLEAAIDGIGNVIGAVPGRERYIIIASHTDTVPEGGWLDGAMGVIFGLEIARALVEAGTKTNIGVKVISFMDEEGRFAALLGSSVFCGVLSLEQAAALRADDGATLDQALQAAGYGGRPIARLDPARDRLCLEAHIEQGPVLERNDKQVGIVTDIAGLERAQLVFFGQADHAGTVPMAMRRDAAAALFDFAEGFARFCRELGDPSVVWNLGHARLAPGAYNVVAREAELFVEYRAASAGALERIRGAVSELATEAAARHSVTHEHRPGVRIVPAAMDKSLVDRLEAAAKKRAAPAMRMSSGAIHDAMSLAARIPTGMLFAPSIGGRSHDVAEDTREEDLALGVEVLGEMVASLIEDGSGPGLA